MLRDEALVLHGRSRDALLHPARSRRLRARRHLARKDIMKILLAIDGSEVSEVAVRAVNERPWPQGSLVRVLHVVEPPFPPAAAPWIPSVSAMQPQVGMQDVQQRMLEHGRDLVRRTAELLALRGLKTESETILGDPREGILDQARDWEADLIVLGSRGNTGFRRWVLGSVAESVVRLAPCSVEVARERGAAPGG
jgi:nucleotide-binding universal stress UspA family protein